MKKLFIVLIAAAFLTACNNDAEKTDNQKRSDKGGGKTGKE